MNIDSNSNTALALKVRAMMDKTNSDIKSTRSDTENTGRKASEDIRQKKVNQTLIQTKAVLNKILDDNTLFSYPIPESKTKSESFSSADLGALASKFQGQGAHLQGESISSLSNAFVAALLEIIDNMLNSAANVITLQQKSFAQTSSALTAAGAMAGTSMEMADSTLAQANSAARTQFMSSVVGLASSVFGLASLAKQSMTPKGTSDQLGQFANRAQSHELDELTKGFKNKTTFEKVGQNLDDPTLVVSAKKDLAMAEAQGTQHQEIMNKTIAEYRSKIEKAPIAETPKLVAELEAKLESLNIAKHPELDSLIRAKLSQDIKVKIPPGLNETDLIHAGIIRKDAKTGDCFLENTFGKVTDEDTVKHMSVSYSPAGPNRTEKLEVRIFEQKIDTKKDEQGKVTTEILAQKYNSYDLSSLEVIGKPGKNVGDLKTSFEQLDKISGHEKLENLTELNDVLQKWDINKTVISQRADIAQTKFDKVNAESKLKTHEAEMQIEHLSDPEWAPTDDRPTLKKNHDLYEIKQKQKEAATEIEIAKLKHDAVTERLKEAKAAREALTAQSTSPDTQGKIAVWDAKIESLKNEKKALKTSLDKAEQEFKDLDAQYRTKYSSTPEEMRFVPTSTLKSVDEAKAAKTEVVKTSKTALDSAVTEARQASKFKADSENNSLENVRAGQKEIQERLQTAHNNETAARVEYSRRQPAIDALHGPEFQKLQQWLAAHEKQAESSLQFVTTMTQFTAPGLITFGSGMMTQQAQMNEALSRNTATQAQAIQGQNDAAVKLLQQTASDLLNSSTTCLEKLLEAILSAFSAAQKALESR